MAQIIDQATAPLEFRKVYKKTIMQSFPTFVLLSVLLIPLFPAMWAFALNYVYYLLALYVALFLALVSLIFTYQYFYYKMYKYSFDDKEMTVAKGVIGRTETTTPYSKIQNVYVDQDILDRIMMLYDVHITTAGMELATTHPLNHVDGLSKANADKVKAFLLKKIKG